MRTLPRLAKLVIPAAALALAAGACGDNGGDDDDDDDMIDAPVADAPVEPDASPDGNIDAGPRDLLAATIALTDITVTNDLSGIGIENLSGAAVSVSYQDLMTATVPPAFGPANIDLGECHVFVYDLTTDPPQAPPSPSDEGAVTVQNTIHGAFQCQFDSNQGSYVCVSATDTATSSVAANALLPEGTVAFSVDGADFTSVSPIGMYVSVSGFANPVNNGVFPVVGFDDTLLGPGTLILSNPGFDPDPVDGDAEGDVADVTHILLPGAGPIPQDDPPTYDFLGDENTDYTVTKTDSDIVPTFTAEIAASGDGFTLATSSPQPHEFPTATGQGDWTLSCGDDGECGPNGGTVVGFALSGSTTDANLATSCPGGLDGTDACLPFEMPDPVDSYATFTCRGELGSADLTLVEAAVDTILGTSPTRVETRVLRVTADLTSDGTGVTAVVAGHGLVGFTDVPQN